MTEATLDHVVAFIQTVSLTLIVGPICFLILYRDKSGSRLEDPNALGMSGLVSLLTVGAVGGGGESFLVASGMSIGRGEKSAGDFPRG
jgi:hypothetical protein